MIATLLAATGAEGGVPVTDLLLDLLVILLAAKIGAELADRLGVPAVVGEIIAGIVIGPSALGLVGESDVLHFLAELGVILLLLEVGLEMDLRELAAVGRSSMQVAVIGVVLPFVAGWGVMNAFGEGGNTALFVGAALTATSVGITARVFGDLRALASSEARTVLGAAVADDVLGLLILTVVVRIVTEGSVSIGTVAEVAGVALLFLVLASVLGVLLAPGVFGAVQRRARSSGTLLALVVVFTLTLAEFANSAKLAPIIGAFVAGIALGRVKQVDRIHRELTPIIHLLVPVFFVQIGVNSEVSQFANGGVLALAACLIVVGIIGKVAAGYFAASSAGDKLLVGIGMIPRGEVGLIFAGIGLTEGVLDDDLYASMLVVVLVTTLITPPLLKLRYERNRGRSAVPSGDAAPPEGGWVQIIDDRVELVGDPQADLALPIALAAAQKVGEHRPGDRLLDWLSHLPDGSMHWGSDATAHLFELLRVGDPRSWRFLSATGVLERALPELAEAIEARRRDPNRIDPAGVLTWELVETLRDELDHAPRTVRDRITHPEWLLLAALVLDITDGDESVAVPAARALTARLALGTEAEEEVQLLVGESGLLFGSSRRVDAFEEHTLAQLASHLRRRERAAALYLLTVAAYDLDTLDHQRLEQQWSLLDRVLADFEDTSPNLGDVLQARSAEARRLLADNRLAVRRIETGPRAWLLSANATALARQAAEIYRVPRGHDVRVFVVKPESTIDVVCEDRRGLLSGVTGALESLGFDVHAAIAATWPDAMALSSFRVAHIADIDSETIRERILSHLDDPVATDAVSGHVVRFDDRGSPWYTVLEVECDDRPGLLHAIAAAIAAAGVDIHSARVRTTADHRAVDSFELTDARGSKLTPAMQERIVDILASGTDGRPPTRRRVLSLRRP